MGTDVYLFRAMSIQTDYSVALSLPAPDPHPARVRLFNVPPKTNIQRDFLPCHVSS